MPYNSVEKAFCVLECAGTQSNKTVQRAFAQRFERKGPDGKQIWTWHKSSNKKVACAEKTYDNNNGAFQSTSQLGDEPQITYSSYLNLREILSTQEMLTSKGGKAATIHDEHLFIVTHQTFELWFKQILYEIDLVRDIFAEEYLEERTQLSAISRLGRVVGVLKLLCSQFDILETMTPQDFLEMRKVFGNSSGFQSFQFRMIEIRLGVREDLRILHNQKSYEEVFFGEEKEKLLKAKSEPSLLSLINNWLERTPGLEEDGFNFFDKFKRVVDEMLNQEQSELEKCSNPGRRDELREEHETRQEMFSSLFDENIHKSLVEKGGRRFTHKATQGALMIYLYREEPRYHLPFQILQTLVDIDVTFVKLRFNHTSMVQRMIGGKMGTGGSSGYHYLRATCSDRYKVFLDLLNIPMFLVTRDRIPPLTENMKATLDIHDWVNKGLQNGKPSSPFLPRICSGSRIY